MRCGRGLEVTAEREAVVCIDDFADRMLRLESGVERVLDAAGMHPDCPLLQLYAAAMNLYAQTAAGDAVAAEFVERARKAAPNRRELLLLEALERWHAHAFLEAVVLLEELTTQWPEDLLAAKFAEFLYYILGQQHMGPRFFAHLERLRPLHGEDADFLSMRAFANELCGRFEEAIADGLASVEIAPRNPWAEHALSHALIRLGRITEGRDRLEHFLPELQTCNRAVYCHDAWHLGLLHLEDMHHDQARAVLETHVWGNDPTAVGEQIDAIALGWRMEMAGASLEAFWSAVADHVENHASECFMPFVSAHHAFALARGGRKEALENLLNTVASRATDSDAEAMRVWRTTGLAVVRASAAHGVGDRAEAAELLEPVMPDITRCGGSDAQDDLFRQAYLTGLIAAGRRTDAAAYLDVFTQGKSATALDAFFRREAAGSA